MRYLRCIYGDSEYLKIFDGNGSLNYHKIGCSSSNGVLLVEVPFLTSSNITASIYVYRLRSAVRVQYLVLRTGLNTGMCTPLAAVFKWVIQIDQPVPGWKTAKYHQINL